MKKRENGFYWIKLYDDDDEWIIAQYHYCDKHYQTEKWNRCGHSISIYEIDISEIDERQIIRNEDYYIKHCENNSLHIDNVIDTDTSDNGYDDSGSYMEYERARDQRLDCTYMHG